MHVYLKRELVESFYYVDFLMEGNESTANMFFGNCAPTLINLICSISVGLRGFGKEFQIDYLPASNQWHAK